MTKKSFEVTVLTVDSELSFVVEPKTLGKELFDKVVHAIGLRETWYFGLQFTHNKGSLEWLKLDKKVLAHDLKKADRLRFNFKVKFYPEEVSEIIQGVTLRLFYRQVKSMILSDEIYCPAETSVLLASYAMQYKYGDYDNEQHPPGFLSSDQFTCKRICDQYDLSKGDWERRVVKWWADHRNLDRETVMTEYLKIAQDLEMYGIEYVGIRNKKGTELFLGIDALGLNVYAKDNQLNPDVGFPWSEVDTLSFNGKKFTIKPVDKSSSNFIFYSSSLLINKRILSLCMGNHELYMRRRKPPTAEVLQMKQQAQDEQMVRQIEQERLSREKAGREAAEQKQREYEEQVQRMKEDMNKAHDDLMVAQDIIYQLEQQLLELNEYKRELELKERELEYLKMELQSERLIGEEERARLVDEIASHETQVAGIRCQVRRKTDEAEKLQREIYGHQICEGNVEHSSSPKQPALLESVDVVLTILQFSWLP